MKHEPPLDRAALLQRVRDCYGLPATGLTFVPVGFAALCYRLHCADERKYFLKLWRDTPPPSASDLRYLIPLRLTRAIYERQIPLRVPYPLFSREGALWASFDGTMFAIFPLLPGEMPASVPPQLVSTWASAMAVLHRATPRLADVLPPLDAFEIEFEAEFRQSLRELEQGYYAPSPSLQAIGTLLLPHLEHIAFYLLRRALGDMTARIQRLLRESPRGGGARRAARN